MPHLAYRGRHQPPLWWEHVLAHPMGLAAAVAGLLVGVQMVISLATDLVVSRVAESLPTWVLAVLAVSLIGGAVAFTLGLLGRFNTLAASQLLVRIGSIGLAVGWLARAFALASVTGTADMTSVTTSLSLSAGCLTMLLASTMTEPILDHDVTTRVRCHRE